MPGHPVVRRRPSRQALARRFHHRERGQASMLMNCAAYQKGRKLADVAIDNLHAYRDVPDAFIWVALKDPGPGELAHMAQQFGLHELAVEDAQTGHQRPKIEEYGDSLFCVLHTVELDAE